MKHLKFSLVLETQNLLTGMKRSQKLMFYKPDMYKLHDVQMNSRNIGSVTRHHLKFYEK